MRYKYNIVLTILMMVILLSPLRISAISQGPDEVSILSPTSGQSIGGVFSVKWRIVDSDVTNPAYFIDIYNLSCDQSGGNLGRLLSSKAKRDGDTYSYDWNMSSGEVSGALQNQGNYCIRICGILADGDNIYSLCDKQSFIYNAEQTGSNKSPIIEPSKESIPVTLNEEFSYQVSAHDPDDDSITFYLINAPDFLNIDSDTGEVTGKPTEIGEIRFIVKADDGKGGVSTEEFSLQVYKEGERLQLELLFPIANSVVTSENNIIKWKLNSDVIPKETLLSYSTNKEKWMEISRVSENVFTYVWDMGGIDDGDYYLKIKLTTKDDETVELISEKFKISEDNNVEGTEIVDLLPKEGFVTTNNRPIISAKFKMPDGVTINKQDVEFKLNGRIDLTVCEVQSDGISCNVISELLDGVHKVELKVIDSEGTSVMKEWSFEINTASDIGGSGGVFSGKTVQLIIVIFAVGFVLIALPWSLYVILKKRKNKTKEEDEVPTYNPPTPIYPVQEDVQYSNLVPMMVSPTSDLSNNQVTVTEHLSTQNSDSTPVGVIPDTMAPMSDIAFSSLPNTQQQADSNNEQLLPLHTQSDESMSLHTAIPVIPEERYQENTSTSVQLTPEQEPANTTIADVNNIQHEVQTQVEDDSPFLPAVPVQLDTPSMYKQEEIPAWLQTGKKEDTPISASQVQADTSDLQKLIESTNVQEGAKVYDPYGLALNSSEENETN